ncbi:MAG TPA: ABC transporter ATP-binding protein [Rhodanobacteraceae bacterium]|nr:ABC transporter ATP-binding protein [Rhodanobacteraceae bacterium]
MNVLLQTQRLQVAFGDDVVLRGIDLKIVQGEWVALVGPNGSGKTTLLRALVGMAPLSAGTVSIGGHDLAAAPRAAKAAVGFAIDPQRLPGLLTGRECLALFAGARGLLEVPRSTVSLAEALALAPVLDRRVANYSLGMRQKLGILLGLLGEPPLLLLDEPFNGLDPRSALVFKQHLDALVARGDISVLVATHSLDIAERHATRVILLMDGGVRHTWSSGELVAMREHPERSLEQAMADACGS